jgi:uncharacterized protein
VSVPNRKPKQYRIVIDPNWYISASISGHSRRTLRKVFTDSRFLVLLSAELLDEYDVVIARKKFRRYLSLDQVSRFRRLVLRRAELYAVVSSVTVCRDINDNYLLALAQDGRADYLISGDPDLLVLKRFGLTKITTMRIFLTRFRLG